MECYNNTSLEDTMQNSVSNNGQQQTEYTIVDMNINAT